jgi:hypothetical protein
MSKKWLFLGVILFSLFGCRKEMTNWDTRWNFPVIQDQLNIQDLVTDSLTFLNDTNGCKLVYEKTLYRLKLSEFIKIPDTTIQSELAINFPSLNVNPGTILSQKDVENQLEIGDAELKKIKVKKGSITITFLNPLTTRTYYTIEIPSFTKDGVPVKKTLMAEKGNVANPSMVKSTLDLSGYSVDLRGVNNNTFNTIVTNFDMQLDPAASAATKVTNKDITKMAIEISGIQIDYAQGYFGNLQIASNTEIPVPVLRKITNGNFKLSDATIELNILNSCKLMARGKINSLLSSNTNTGTNIIFQNQQLNNPFFIAPAWTKGDQLIPTDKKFNLNASNSNLLTFIENLGDLYRINYDFELNPYGNLNGGWDEFFPTSEISLDLKSIIPLQIQVNNLSFKDTLLLDLSNLPNGKSIKKGLFKLHCVSSFPIDAAVTLILLDASKKTIETIVGTSVIAGKSKFSSENKISNVYFTPTLSFFTKMNTVKYVIVKTTFNSVVESFEIPYNGKIDFQLSTDFEINNQY